MGALKIECYLSELQIRTIIEDIEKHISDFEDYGINEYEGLFGNDIHVFVDFEALSHNRIGLKNNNPGKQSIEVLSSDYDLLEEDTAVLKSYLKQTIGQYNNNIEQGLSLSDGYIFSEELNKERYYHNKYSL